MSDDDLELWRSSDLFLPTSNRRVLSFQTIKLILGLSVVNMAIWITSIVLQILLLANMEPKAQSWMFMLVCMATIWSIIVLIVTVVSICGLLRNQLPDVKAYVAVTGLASLLAVIIFIFNLVTLASDTFDWAWPDVNQWMAPGSFSTFCGLFVFGANAIGLFLIWIEYRQFRRSMEEERTDKIRQHLRQQQEVQIRQLEHMQQLELVEQLEQEERLRKLEALEYQANLRAFFNVSGPLNEDDRLSVTAPVAV